MVTLAYRSGLDAECSMLTSKGSAWGTFISPRGFAISVFVVESPVVFSTSTIESRFSGIFIAAAKLVFDCLHNKRGCVIAAIEEIVPGGKRKQEASRFILKKRKKEEKKQIGRSRLQTETFSCKLRIHRQMQGRWSLGYSAFESTHCSRGDSCPAVHSARLLRTPSLV